MTLTKFALPTSSSNLRAVLHQHVGAGPFKMGGCRCTYRNCSVKSDGVTHMFHYPVFDKSRCHQWLINAQQLEFFHLTVAQLKNRVICQHHFKPDMFMNYKMNKLRYYAVPTENGPFCDSPDWPNENLTEIISQVLPDLPEEIENDQLTLKEKLANHPVKYGDFLVSTDSDITEKVIKTQPIFNDNSIVHIDSNTSMFTNPQSKVKVKVKVTRVLPTKRKKEWSPLTLEVPALSDSNLNKTKTFDMSWENNNHLGSMNTVNAYAKKDKKVKILYEEKISGPVTVQGKMEPVSPSLILHPQLHKEKKKGVPIVTNTSDKQKIDQIEDMDVIIYNPPESTVDQQITFIPQSMGQQTDRCTFVVSPIDKRFDTNIIEMASLNDIHNPIPDQDKCDQTIPIEIEPIKSTGEISLLQDKNIIMSTHHTKTTNSSALKMSPLKSKIPPERVAAIEEKRKFNKKMRDMIEFCLDELDSPEKQSKENIKSNETEIFKQSYTDQFYPHQATVVGNADLKKTQKINNNQSDLKEPSATIKEKEERVAVKPCLSQEPDLSNTGEYNLASLGAKLKKMELNLLQKIEQNANCILDLKNAITPPAEKRSVLIQTKEDEECYKKRLFQEMSQFLTPETSSVVYEELFLNKFSKVTSLKCPETKPKRRRR